MDVVDKEIEDARISSLLRKSIWYQEVERLLSQMRRENPYLMISDEVELLVMAKDKMELEQEISELKHELSKYKTHFGFCENCGSGEKEHHVANGLCDVCKNDRDEKLDMHFGDHEDDDHEDYCDEEDDDLPF
jgi:hypothetical protein